MLARLPEVEALLKRALELDETWEDGTLHEFKVTFAGAIPGQTDDDEIRRHYDRALELSGGRSVGLYVAYAEAVSVPTQNAAEFREMMEKALAVDTGCRPRQPARQPDRSATSGVAARTDRRSHP